MRYFIVLVIILLAPGAMGWEQFKGNPGHNEVAPSNHAINGTLRWKYITGGEVHGSPAVGNDGTVYASSLDGKLYAIKRDGALLWSYSAETPIWTSPAIAKDGTIYVLEEQGILHAVDPDGIEIWKYRARESVFHSSPAVDKSGNIYFGTEKGTLNCIKPDGKLKWLYKAGDYIESTPAIAPDGTVYVGSGDKKVHAVGPLGRAKWTEPFTTRAPISSSACLGGDGSILIGSGDGYLYDLWSNGTLKWKAKVGEVHLSSPAIAGDRVLIGTWAGEIVCVNKGSIEWKFKTMGAIECSPVLTDDGLILFGSTDETFRCLDLKGVQIWKFTSGGVFGSSSPGFDGDGTIFVGSIDGALYAIGRQFPGPPRFLQTVPGNSNITLIWSRPVENTTLHYYLLYRSTDGKSFEPISEIDAPILRYTDIGLVNGRTYSYKVSANNDVGEGPFSNIAIDVPHAQHVPDPSKDDEFTLKLIHYLLFAAIVASIVAIMWFFRRGKEGETIR